jgi:hypothetical protein
MRTKFILLCAGVIMFSAGHCAAQQANGWSDIYSDDSSGRVVASCTTYLDYDVAAYYQAGVYCSIVDEYGYEVAADGSSSLWGMAQASTSASAQPGMLYAVWGWHDGQPFVHAAGLFPDQWTDYYNFLSLDPYIWPDWNNPQYFSLMGPGPPIGTDNTDIQLATTYSDCFAGRRVDLIGTNCNANPTYTYSGNWGDLNDPLSCLIVGPIAVPPGGTCVAGRTTVKGTAKQCYQTNVNGCATTWCVTDTRVVDAQCRMFLDTNAYTRTTVPAGCS